MKALLAAVLLLASASAQANVWDRAIDGKSSADPNAAVYEVAMREGDDHVLTANTQSSSRSEIKRQVSLAVDKYRRAAAARPTAAEPYFRLANTLHSFYLDNCNDNPLIGLSRSPLKDCTLPDEVLDVAIAEETIAAWQAAEARAPLDPRFSGGDGDGVLFRRALVHTKLGTKEHLRAAMLDYQVYLDRADDSSENLENALSNLAETHMMLGNIDEAISLYREALIRPRGGGGGDVSTVYGLAVALDRGERPSSARRLIIDQTHESYETFRLKIDRRITFFVPTGEKFYYFALIEETFGNVDEAIDKWRAYIRSGAHPQYQPRAREHIDALIAKKRAQGRPVPPPDPFMDLR